MICEHLRASIMQGLVEGALSNIQLWWIITWEEEWMRKGASEQSGQAGLFTSPIHLKFVVGVAQIRRSARSRTRHCTRWIWEREQPRGFSAWFGKTGRHVPKRDARLRGDNGGRRIDNAIYSPCRWPQHWRCSSSWIREGATVQYSSELAPHTRMDPGMPIRCFRINVSRPLAREANRRKSVQHLRV